jgi:hypothetical protein
MTEKLELLLVKKYPKILKNYHGNRHQSCMAWGFEFQDGWYKLAEETLDKLNLISIVTGFDIVLDQSKEKFSALRTYWHLENTESKYIGRWQDIIDDVMDMAEHKSRNICEICGQYGQCCNKGYWVKTLCKEDAKKLGYKYKE